MFDMVKIGETISSKRREKQLTQGQFADILNITHQAVSKWERGETMPEISKLVEISEILDLSLDEILKPAEIICPLDKDESDIINKSEKKSDGIDNVNNYAADLLYLNAPDEIPITDLIEIAPQMSQKVLFEACVYKQSVNGMFAVRNLFPFLSQEYADELGRANFKIGGFNEIKYLCKYMSTELLDSMLKREISNSNLNDVIHMIPYISKKTIEKLASESYNLYGIASIKNVVSYLDVKFLEKLVDEEVENVGGWGTIDYIIPYLPRESVLKLAMKFYKKNGIASFNGRFSLLGDYVTGELVADYIEKNNYIKDSWGWCGYILPYAKPERLEEIILTGYRKQGYDSIKYVIKYLSMEAKQYLKENENRFN